MRITTQEKQAFIAVLAKYIDEDAELRLYGSRANDNAKGGDIDLVLITSHKTAEKLMYFKAKILSEIKTIIGDQKIDLLIATFHDQDIFVQTILPSSVLLYQFTDLGNGISSIA